MKRARLGLGLVLISAALAGCGATHYRITDSGNGKVYYTTDMRTVGGGAVQFTDARTGNKVTVQNSEVTKVNEETFKAETHDH